MYFDFVFLTTIVNTCTTVNDLLVGSLHDAVFL